MKINLFHLPSSYCRRRREVLSCIRRVLKTERRSMRYLNIIFATNPQMRALNRRFLKRDYPTDVLSFQLDADYGEIYLAARQLTGYQHLKELLIHGLLHLAGHDHARSRGRRRMLDRTARHLGITD